MFEKTKKDLNYLKHQIMLFQGFINGNITEFDDELYEKLSKVYYKGVPVSFYVKYLVTCKFPKYIDDRIYLMFLSLPNALLIKGKTKELFNIYEIRKEEYEWIEFEDYVYDIVTLLRFKKEIFYKIFSPEDINRFEKKEFLETIDAQKEYKESFFINDGINKPNKDYINKYYSFITKIKDLAFESGNVNFINDYLKFSYYIQKDIDEEMDRSIKALER